MQQQCHTIHQMSWFVSGLPPTLVSIACFSVRNTPPSVLFALSMIPMVAWLSFGERYIRGLCWRHACALRRMRLRVTSSSRRNNVLASERLHAYSICQGGNHEGIARGLRGDHRCCLAFRFSRVEYDRTQDSRCTRLNKGMYSHSTLFDPL